MEINLCMFDIFNPGASVFLESPSNFSGPKSCFMFAMFAFKIKVSVILKMILVTMKLPVNEAKLTSLWARNFATIQQVLILKFPFRSERYWAFRETDPCLVSYHVKQFIYCVFRQKLKQNWWRSMLIILWVFLLMVSLYFNKSSVIWNIENNLLLECTTHVCNIFYYITTNEIPGGLSCKKHAIFARENNMLSSHVKRSPLLWLCNKSLLSQEKAITVEAGHAYPLRFY